MKYITKEWYETCQVISLFSSLRVSKKAGIYSEGYFRKLYKNREEAWLSHLEELSNIQIKDFCYTKGEFEDENVDNYPIELSDIEETNKEFEKGIVCLPVEPYIFDPEQERKNYKKRFQNTVNSLKRNLPKEILEKVKDIRVLALNHATADIKKEITEYCTTIKKAIDSASESYWKEFESSFKSSEPTFVKKFNFHDWRVISCRKKGKDIVVMVDNSDVFKTTRQITLKSCSIIKQDKLLHGARWLYHEIYKIRGGYEIHVLLDNKEELIDFIVNVADVEYK